MILSEVKELQELSIEFTQAILDSKIPQEWNYLLKAKSFDSVFTQLYNLALKSKLTSDSRVIAMFDFLGKKINAPNKKEYANAVLIDVENHLTNNGVQIK